MINWSTGTSQGSSLSPLLFNLYLSNLNSIIKHPFECIVFADDIVIMITENKNKTSFNELENRIINWTDWFEKKKRNLIISETKSNNIMSFSNSRKPHEPIIQKTNIPIVNSTKYLGIFLDRKLNWNIHIKHLINKGNKMLNILSMEVINH